MAQDESQSLDYLKQIRIIEEYSSGDRDSLNKLYFQEMVLEALNPEEREAYMRFLLEPRPRGLEEVGKNDRFGGNNADGLKKGFLSKLKGITDKYNKL